MLRLAVTLRFEMLRLAVTLHDPSEKRQNFNIFTGYCPRYFPNIVLRSNELQDRQLFRAIIPDIQITQNAMFFVDIL